MAVPTLETLPTELLDAVLGLMPTPELAALAPVSRRFCAAVNSLIRRRMLHALAQADYQLTLEFYPPSGRLSTPSLHCHYRKKTEELVGSTGSNISSSNNRDEAFFKNLYSRFRPQLQNDFHTRQMMRQRSRRRPALSYRLTPAVPVPESLNDDPADNFVDESPVSVDVQLNEGELFLQLCSVTSLVKAGPRHGLFASYVLINDSVIRVWRDWLAQQRIGLGNDSNDDNVLWADTHKTVGIRVHVRELATQQQQQQHYPITLANEEPALAYTLELEAFEKSQVHDLSAPSNAVVLAAI